MSTRNGRLTDVPGFTVVTPGNDFLVYEKVSADKYRDGVALPALGSAHERASILPNYELCGIVEDGEDGHLRFYYAKTRASQEAYNFEYRETVGTEWPECDQTWVVKRDGYTPGAASWTAPGSLGGRTWSYKEEVQQRTDPITDGLFVVVRVTWWDISTARSGVRWDSETGAVRPFSVQIVAAGTSGQATNSSGQYKEVRPLNRLYSELTTEQAAGLAGGASGGTAARDPFPAVINYYWPPVVSNVEIVAIPDPSGGVAAIFARPIYAAYAHSGPCEAEITETWTLAEPVVSAPTPMLPVPIDFDGAMLRLSIPPCLHPTLEIWEGTGGTDTLGAYQLSRSYPATNYSTWPASMVASVDVTPGVNGGYLTRITTVFRPTVATVPNDIVLTVTSASGLATLSWVRNNAAGNLVKYYVSIAADPNMLFGFIVNEFDNGTSTTFSQQSYLLTSGTPYYCRIRATFTSASSPVYSNVAAFIVTPSPRIQLSDNATGTVISDDGAYSFGSVSAASGTIVKTFKVLNTGDYDLEDLAVTISGTHAADYSVTTALGATTLAPAVSTTFAVTFNPSAGGARTCSIDVASNDPGTNRNPCSIAATGTGLVPEIGVEDFDSNPLTSGVGWVTYGDVLAASSNPSGTFTILNSGDDDLTGVSVSYDDQVNVSITPGTAPTTPVVPSGATTFDFNFQPTVVGGWSATINIANSDSNENPFVIFVTGNAT